MWTPAQESSDSDPGAPWTAWIVTDLGGARGVEMSDELNDDAAQPQDEQTPADQPVDDASSDESVDPEQAIEDAEGLAEQAAAEAEEEELTDEEAAALQGAMAALQGLGSDVAAAASPDPEPGAVAGASDDTSPFVQPEFGDSAPSAEKGDLDLLADVHLNVHIELGRTSMFVEDVLRLGGGAVVELDKLAGDPVDVFVNDRKVARGEVLVLNDNFCVRISEIVDIQDS